MRMRKELYSKIPKWAIIAIVFTGLIILIFVVRFIFVSGKNNNIPVNFLEAKNKAAIVAKDIVEASNNSSKTIDEVSKLSNEEKYDEALNLLAQEIKNGSEIQKKENELLTQLAIMTSNASKISPQSSQQLVLEAIGVETRLVQNLMAYSQDLLILLQTIQKRLLNQEGGTQQKIDDLIKKINDEAKAVNDLNRQFNDIMNKLDFK